MKTPRHIGLFSLALVSLLLALPAHAARLALVIGNDAYNQVAALKNARNDARLVAGVLRKAGFEVSEASNLNRTALWSTLDRFKGRINKGDEVVFYFAGHGVQVGANQLLLPTDISADNDSQVQRDGVPLIDVQDALKDARLAMLLIDACRDNPFPKTGTRTIGSTRGLSPPEASTGQIIMMSAGRNQKALDYVPNSAQANGLFAWELSQVLQTPGLEIRNALEDVKNRVDDKARRAGHEQRPSLVNDLRGSFYLSSGPTVQVASLRPEPATHGDDEMRVQAQAAPAPLLPTASTEPIDGRYEILAGGAEVKDTQTGLIWQRCEKGQLWSVNTCTGEGKKFTFEDAQKQAANVWRIPTIDELKTLLTKEKADDRFMNTRAFPNSNPEIWSASPSFWYSDYAWYVDFYRGRDFHNRLPNNYGVRLVRAGR